MDLALNGVRKRRQVSLYCIDVGSGIVDQLTLSASSNFEESFDVATSFQNPAGSGS